MLRQRDETGLPAQVQRDTHKGAAILSALLQRPDVQIEVFGPGNLPAAQRGYALLVQLSDQSWVLFHVNDRSWGLDELPRNLIILALMMFSSLAVAWFAARYLADPLERFTEGARRFGKDFNAPPIPVVGPHDLRQAILRSTPPRPSSSISSMTARRCWRPSPMTCARR